MVARCFLKLGEQIPIVGVGGIDSVETAIAKIEAGARLIQIYTGLIYGGTGLVARIVKGLTGALESREINSVQDLVGLRASQISAQ